MQMPLQRERWAVKSLVETDRQQMLGLAGLALASIIAPMVLKPWLPLPLRTLSLLMGTAASAGLAAVSYQSATKERKEESDRLHRIQTASYTNSLAHQVTQQNLLGDMLAKQSLVNMLQRLPVQQRMIYGQQYGVYNLLRFPELEQPGQSTPAPVAPTQQSPGQVIGYHYEPEPEPEASVDWISALVNQFAEPDPERRIYAHLIVNGPTRSGKSTLVSKLLEMISTAVAGHGQTCQMMLIDPKYPKTKWPLEPAFKGFGTVRCGLDVAISEFRQRKEACITAEKAGKPHPSFPRLIVVVDEQDSIYNEGKGHPELGSDRDERKEAAQDIHSMEVNLLKESAAYDISLFVVGQSPLSGATGFSRSDMQQACRIVLGNEALRWLSDRDFPFKEDVPELAGDLKYWMDKGDRVALVCPNMGRAYVSAIPKLEIKAIAVDQSPAPQPQTALPKGDGNVDPLEGMRQWLAEYRYTGGMPTDEEIRMAWAVFSDVQLTDNGLALLKEKLGIADDNPWNIDDATPE